MSEQEVVVLKRYSMWKNHFEKEAGSKANSAQFNYHKTSSLSGCHGCSSCEGCAEQLYASSHCQGCQQGGCSGCHGCSGGCGAPSCSS